MRELRLELDVDGDGAVDRLRAEDSAGSGMGMTSLERALSTLSEPIEIDYQYTFSGFVDTTVIPDALEQAGACALAIAEELLFRHAIESERDPSLVWLLESSKRLRWPAREAEHVHGPRPRRE